MRKGRWGGVGGWWLHCGRVLPPGASSLPLPPGLRISAVVTFKPQASAAATDWPGREGVGKGLAYCHQYAHNRPHFRVRHLQAGMAQRSAGVRSSVQLAARQHQTRSRYINWTFFRWGGEENGVLETIEASRG